MIMANDIREIKFSHSLGGYKIAEVDEFLDRCADTVEELTRQNDEDSKKMQVLADSIMDYRNQEDSIRSALISAQRMSESVIGDARKQAEEILSAAREEADSMHEKALKDTTAEQDELLRVRREVADFKARLLSIYREHLTLIGVLEDEDSVPAPAEQAEKKQPEIEEPTENSSSSVEADAQDARASYREVPDFSAYQLNEEE